MPGEAGRDDKDDRLVSLEAGGDIMNITPHYRMHFSASNQKFAVCKNVIFSMQNLRPFLYLLNIYYIFQIFILY